MEAADAKGWKWDPSKVFYLLMEAFVKDWQRRKGTSVFQRYNASEVKNIFKKEILDMKSELNIVLGSEAMDKTVKSETGESVLLGLQSIFPTEATVTCVIVYRTPSS